MPTQTTKTVHCNHCHQDFDISVDIDRFNSWQNGKLIQDAMPDLTAGERELFISGTCDDCFTKMFGNNDIVNQDWDDDDDDDEIWEEADEDEDEDEDEDWEDDDVEDDDEGWVEDGEDDEDDEDEEWEDEDEDEDEDDYYEEDEEDI